MSHNQAEREDSHKALDRHSKQGDDVQKGVHDALFNDSYNKGDKQGRDGDKERERLTVPPKPEVTREERQAAKHKLDDHVSPLVPDHDRRVARQISHSILEGHPKELQETLSKLKDEPKKLHKFIEETNHNMKEAGANTSLAIDERGRVLAYKDNGKTAVQMNLENGNLKVRPIVVDSEGNATVRPGEILNADPYKTMKSIGDSAVRNINNDGPINVWPPFTGFPGFNIPGLPGFDIGTPPKFPGGKSNDVLEITPIHSLKAANNR
jgi:hypothetical protein